MNESDKRLRHIEIEIATMRQNVERNTSDIEALEIQLEKNTARLDRWGGGSVIVTKIVGLICSLVGVIIALVKAFTG